MLNLYTRYKFNINQLISIEESYKLLPENQSRALLYQGYLLSKDDAYKIKILEILKNSFDKSEIGNALDKKLVEMYCRQIILNDVGPTGQKKIINSKVLVVGAGGLGCPVIDYLSRAGVGNIGVIDHDKVSISNIHRQSLYDSGDIAKFKVSVLKKKI